MHVTWGKRTWAKSTHSFWRTHWSSRGICGQAHRLPLFLLKTCQTIFQANLLLSLLLIGLALSFGLDRSEIGLMLRALSVRYALGFVMAA